MTDKNHNQLSEKIATGQVLRPFDVVYKTSKDGQELTYPVMAKNGSHAVLRFFNESHLESALVIKTIRK